MVKYAYTGDLVLQQTQDFNEEELLSRLRKTLEKENAKLIVNLESAFVQKNKIKEKDKICLGANDTSLRFLKKLNPLLINLSNNHINDYGVESCEYTFQLLKNAGLEHFGVGTIAEKSKHIVVSDDSKTINIAYVTRSADLTGTKLFADTGFVGGYEVDLQEIVDVKKKYPDYHLIVNIHWGIEDIKFPEPEKIDLAHNIIDAGADLIIGHHPHIIQPVESYKGKLIFYSLGNFYFPDIDYEYRGLIKSKKALKHQRKGLVPIIDFTEESIVVKKILLIERNVRGNKLRIKESKLSGISSMKPYSENWWLGYYKRLLFQRKIRNLINNPDIIIKGIRDRLSPDYKEKRNIFWVLLAFLFKIYLSIRYFYRERILSEKAYIIKKYKRVFGKYPDLKNPQLFTEKIQWMKLNDRTTMHTICADKFKVRDYVQERAGEKYLIPLVFETKNVDEIIIENIPNCPVIIKTNHDSSGGIIIKDKGSADFEQIRKVLRSRLKKNYYYTQKEWEYKNIQPRVIVEKLLKDKSGNNLLNDYKIYCFGGKPKYIQTLFDRETDIKETWFDTNWIEQEFFYFSNERKKVERPVKLEEMLEVARKLSEPFYYVRVDLYDVNNVIYFGELTFHPYGGFMKWNPEKMDLKLGQKLKLPIDE
ncbi:ATP-grasp fold amidoligase family protein [uncultured Draconibacterium sp.]|uniref:ATP-grasp fold amidoligase family protein n=1 Tax=uncultured Draconibacterium sp. TaxID=1573823 RepID=UPI0025DC4F55|nr:ATP-grasp fold amidoligase family protein [uncultured Draconibacterium sp.]